MGRFSLKKLNNVEDREKYQVTVVNGFLVLEKLDESRAINRSCGWKDTISESQIGGE